MGQVYMSKPPKRRITGDWGEQDVYTKWRYVLCWTSRPGATKKVKKLTHRRERREGKKEIEDQLDN